MVEGNSSVTRDIYLGTCSSGTCKPDRGVTSVDFVIRVNYTNGEVGQVQQSVSMEE